MPELCVYMILSDYGMARVKEIIEKANDTGMSVADIIALINLED